MSASGGTRRRPRAALLLPAVLAVAAALAGCEYADDVGLSPAAASPPAPRYPARPPLPSQDPQIGVAEARNMTELQRLLGAPPGEILTGGAGGIGGGGFRTSRRTADKGTYTVTAACVGAPDAHLSISQDSGTGGPGLELNLDCGAVTEATVELKTGPVRSHFARLDTEPGAGGGGGGGGVRIVPGSPKS